jgi:hypothetical protein
MDLYSFFGDPISTIINSIMQQFSFITDQVTAPLKNWVGQVTGGIWKGNGADKFVAEMTDSVIPMIAGLLTGTQNYANAIKKSVEHMEQAFNQANSIVQTLFDPFQGIF